MTVQQRKRAKAITAALSTEYSEKLPPGVFRKVNVKFSGIMAASGAGVNAGDGPFQLLGRVEFADGGEVKIGLHGADIRHISAILTGTYPEILPPTIANAAAWLAQAEIPLDRLIPFGGIDNRAGNLECRGRLRAIANLGTTVTALTSNKLRFAAETGDFPNGADCFEPRWTSNTIDTSAASADLSTKKDINNDVEICAGIFIRTFDASLEVADPNTYRSDGMVREIRIDLNRNGQTIEVGRWSWGEAKQIMQQQFGITAAAGQVQTGVVLLPMIDPKGPGGRLRLVKGDSLIVRVDTVQAVEDEFTALTPAAGDLAVVSFLHYVPRGPGVNAIRRRLAAAG
jgi:hypothetical protein